VELASLILRTSIERSGSERPCCAGCGRTPLDGEVIHTSEAERVLCSLCVGREPEGRRGTSRVERVHVGDRPLRILPRAA